MSRRYKNSHVDIRDSSGSVAAQNYNSGGGQLQSQYQSNYPSQYQSNMKSEAPSQDNMSEPQIQMPVVMSPREARRKAPVEVAGRSIGSHTRSALNSGRRAAYNVKNSARRAGGRVARSMGRGGRRGRMNVHPVDKAYKCLFLCFLIDVLLWGLTALAAVVPWFFDSIFEISFTYLIALLPGVIMELICIIKGVHDRNYNFIACTLKVREYGSLAMIAIGLIMLLVGLIMIITGTDLIYKFNWDDDFNKSHWASFLFWSGVVWLAVGIVSYFVTLFFSLIEWKKINSY